MYSEMLQAAVALVGAFSAGLAVWVKSYTTRNNLRLKDLEDSNKFMREQVDGYRDQIIEYQRKLVDLQESHRKEIVELKAYYKGKIAELKKSIADLKSDVSEL